MDMSTDLKPYAVTYSEQFDYEVREQALRILDQGCTTMGRVWADEVLAHPRAREILMCLASMAFGGFVDYYAGNCGVDTEAARWAVSREYGIAWDLAHIEQQIETLDGRPELNLFTRPEPPTELVAQRAECAAILSGTTEFREQYAQRVAKLPPGIVPDPRGVALLRWRNSQ
jgi:hypothetical protein